MDIKVTEQQLIEWVNEYTDDLVRWAFFRTKDNTVAEDLVQDTFLSAFKNLAKFNQSSAPKTWLTAILKNKIIDYHRKQIKSIEIPHAKLLGQEGESDFDEFGGWLPNRRPELREEHSYDLLDDEDFQEVFKNCLSNLPSQWMTAVQYKYLDEKKAQDICQELNVSTSNYWQLLHRAKMRLKNCLNQNWYEKNKASV